MKISFGEWVRTLRRRNKLTLRDLETVSGICNATISQVENGSNPTLLTANTLANSFDYKLWEALKEIDDE